MTRVLCPGEREEDSVSKPRDKVMIMIKEKKEIEFIDHNPHKSIVWGGGVNKRHERRNREERRDIMKKGFCDT